MKYKINYRWEEYCICDKPFYSYHTTEVTASSNKEAKQKALDHYVKKWGYKITVTKVTNIT